MSDFKLEIPERALAKNTVPDTLTDKEKKACVELMNEFADRLAKHGGEWPVSVRVWHQYSPKVLTLVISKLETEYRIVCTDKVEESSSMGPGGEMAHRSDKYVLVTFHRKS